jgi:hypothetical protein
VLTDAGPVEISVLFLPTASALGLDGFPMRVDNAAGCIVACVNTQRRDVARRHAPPLILHQREMWRQGTRPVARP